MVWLQGKLNLWCAHSRDTLFVCVDEQQNTNQYAISSLEWLSVLSSCPASMYALVVVGASAPQARLHSYSFSAFNQHQLG